MIKLQANSIITIKFGKFDMCEEQEETPCHKSSLLFACCYQMLGRNLQQKSSYYIDASRTTAYVPWALYINFVK